MPHKIISNDYFLCRNLIDEMVTEEEKRRTTLKDNIKYYTDELSVLCAELHVTPLKVSVCSQQCS